MSLPDLKARERARREVTRSLAVEAAAGTGKTTVLVDRVLALLEHGLPLTRLAVITFLEAAGEELRSRLGAALRDRDEPWAEEARVALPQAAIGTVHSFARRLLAQYGEEAGLGPPRAVLLPTEAEELRRQVLRDWLRRVLEEDPAPLTRVRRLGGEVTEEWLLGVAARLGEEDGLVPSPPPEPREVEAWVQDLFRLAELARACEERAPRDDRGWTYVRALPRLWTQMQAASSFEERLALVCRAPLPPTRLGNRARWGKAAPMLDALREGVAALTQAQERLRARAGAWALSTLWPLVGRLRQEWRERKEQEGVWEFEDLIREAERMLSSHPQIQERVRDQYRAILVDEVQDTDPGQVRLLRLLAEGRPGALFLVGDARQSIYGFRGVQPDLFSSLVDTLPADARLSLVANFRSRPQILGAVNALVQGLFPGHPPLSPMRREEGSRPRVWVVTSAGAASAAEARAREAQAAAKAVAWALREGWPVLGPEGPRPLQPGDVALLLRTRTGLRAYVEAFRARGIPAHAGRDPGALRRPVARSLLLVLQALVHPDQPYAVALALRSPALGCSDEDLVRHAEAGGGFSLWDPPPPHAPPRVRAALDALGELAEHYDNPLVLTVRAVQRLRLLELATLWEGEAGRAAVEAAVEAVARMQEEDPRLTPADALRRLRQEYESLDGPVGRLCGQAGGEGAVRVLSVHEAKGLEFPLVVVGQVHLVPGRPERPAVIREAAGEAVAVRLPGVWEMLTPGYEELLEAQREERRREGRRLLYVALTRAQEYLVVLDVPVGDVKEDTFATELMRATGAGSVREALVAAGAREIPAGSLPEDRWRQGGSASPSPLFPSGDEEAARRTQARAAVVSLPRPRGARGPEGALGEALREAFLDALADGVPPSRAAAGACGRLGVEERREEVARAVAFLLEQPLVARVRGARARAVRVPVTLPLGDAVVCARLDAWWEEPGGNRAFLLCAPDRVVPGDEDTLWRERGYARVAQACMHALSDLWGRRVAGYTLFLRTGRVLGP